MGWVERIIFKFKKHDSKKTDLIQQHLERHGWQQWKSIEEMPPNIIRELVRNQQNIENFPKGFYRAVGLDEAVVVYGDFPFMCIRFDLAHIYTKGEHSHAN